MLLAFDGLRQGTFMSMASANHDVAILSRVIGSQAGTLSAEAARSLLNLRLDPRDAARMEALSNKAKAGLLTEGEQSELDSFHRVGHLVELLWAEARQTLRDTEH